jgi:hypothetical protein
MALGTGNVATDLVESTELLNTDCLSLRADR